ncbi:hypothetical protein, partial [Tessaracoccus sp.]
SPGLARKPGPLGPGGMAACRMEGDRDGHKHWREQLALASGYYRERGELDMVDDVSRAVRESYARHRVLISR